MVRKVSKEVVQDIEAFRRGLYKGLSWGTRYNRMTCLGLHASSPESFSVLIVLPPLALTATVFVRLIFIAGPDRPSFRFLALIGSAWAVIDPNGSPTGDHLSTKNNSDSQL